MEHYTRQCLSCLVRIHARNGKVINMLIWGPLYCLSRLYVHVAITTVYIQYCPLAPDVFRTAHVYVAPFEFKTKRLGYPPGNIYFKSYPCRDVCTFVYPNKIFYES